MKAFLKRCEMPWPEAEQKGLLTACRSFALAHTDRPTRSLSLPSMRADDCASNSSDEEGSVEYVDFHIGTDDEDLG